MGRPAGGFVFLPVFLRWGSVVGGLWITSRDAFRVRPGEREWRRRQRRWWLRPCGHAPAVEATAVAYDADDPQRRYDARHACRSDARAATHRGLDRAEVRRAVERDVRASARSP